MITPEEHLFGTAKTIALSTEEKEMLRKKLVIAVRNGGSIRHQYAMDERSLLSSAKTISLTPRERVTIRESLMHAIKPSLFSKWWVHPFKGFASLTASLLIVCITSGSMAYAAESAMPGDLLYPVKMHVNEKVEFSLARTPKERATVAMKHVEKRLKEAEMLASTASLDTETETMLAGEIRRNTDTIQATVDSMMEEHAMEDAGTICITFEATLGAHEKLLGRIRPNETIGMKTLMQTLEEARMNIEETTLASIADLDDGDDGSIFVATAIKAASGEMGNAQALMRRSGDMNELSVAEHALSESASNNQLPLSERAKLARSALRNAKKATIMAAQQPSRIHSVNTDAAPPAAMMMKVAAPSATEAVPARDMTFSAIEDSTAPLPMNTDDLDDLEFDTKVRLNLAEKKLNRVRSMLKEHEEGMPEGIPIPVEARMTGSEQLMNMAKMQRDEGRMKEALDASDAALRHAKAASKALKTLLPEEQE